MLNWLFCSQSPVAVSVSVPQKLMEYGVVAKQIFPCRGGTVQYQGRWYRAKCPLAITIAEEMLVIVKEDLQEYLEVIPLDN